MYHIPVLLKESIDGLRIKPEGTYVDATFGGGGHSMAILREIGKGRLFAFDRDPSSVANKPEDDRFKLISHNFRYLRNYLTLYNAHKIDGLLADLGVSSHQFDNPERGFSTRFKGGLDMRMDPESEITAAEIVNNYTEEELTKVFASYGEIPTAAGLSRLICKERKLNRFESTDQLVKVCFKLAPGGKENKFLAQVFQALRIEVNDELEALKNLLEQAAEIIYPGGRLVIISYHSLEDRLVKNFIRSGNFEGKLKKDFYGNPLLTFRAINKKPIVPKENEIESNKRARSAKLRIAEKI
jgi:16S rRNA (cytosine1402-N4)-methyltransferase